MGQLQGIAGELEELGYEIVAVGPGRPEKLKASLDKNAYGFVLASDSDMAAARAFGIAFKLDDSMVDRLKQFGIDVEEDSGRDHHVLPVPAVFLTIDGKIVFEYVNPNYQERIDPDVLLAAARAAVG